MDRLTAIKDLDHRTTAAISYHYQEAGEPYNWVTTATYHKSDGSRHNTTRQFYDGLGRPSVSCTDQMTPRGKYSYTLSEYDLRGNCIRSWMPVPFRSLSGTGKTSADVMSASSTFYGDSYGFQSTEYDALRRVVKSTTPGAAWHQGGRSKAISYRLNESGSVRKYDTISRQDTLPYSYYVHGDLVVEETEDEDGHRSATYRDGRSLTVMERSYKDGETNDTYYVYDDKGQLCWVLQPNYQENADLKCSAFHYRYDEKGQCVKRRLPGCGPESYSYDAQGRLVKAQNVEQCRTYEYDALGRVTVQRVTGSQTEGQGEEELRNYYDCYDFLYSLYGQDSEESTILHPGTSDHGHGQLTGTYQRTSTGETLLTVYGYDRMKRPSETHVLGLDGHLSIARQDYSFAGDVTCQHFE